MNVIESLKHVSVFLLFVSSCAVCPVVMARPTSPPAFLQSTEGKGYWYTCGWGLARCINCEDLSLTFIPETNFVRLAAWKLTSGKNSLIQKNHQVGTGSDQGHNDTQPSTLFLMR